MQVPDDVYDSELSRFQGMLDALRAAGEARAAQELENDSPLKQVVSMGACVVVRMALQQRRSVGDTASNPSQLCPKS